MRWAAEAFAGYDKSTVDRIVAAAAGAGAATAAEHARLAVAETGFGVPAHQELASLACARHLSPGDFVSPQTAGGRLRIPHPVGIVLARTPRVMPVAAVYRAVLAALRTRNAMVVQPHPDAREVSTRAARVLAGAAVAAGAPAGAIEVAGTGFGGADLVLDPPDRPDNAPVIVDETADLPAAAQSIVDAAAFDNSTVDGAPSVVVATVAVADKLVALMAEAGAHLLPSGAPVTGDFLGWDAARIAGHTGLAAPAGTRVLVVPFDLAVPEEPLAHPKPYPVLGLLRVTTADRAVHAARAVLRLGAGRRAAVHTTDPAALTAYLAGLPVDRVSVNGAGDGVLDRLGADPLAERLVRWTTIATPGSELPTPPAWTAPAGPVPAYPHASNGS